MISAGLGFEAEQVLITGNETGHLGTSDVFYGLQRLHELGEIDGPITLGASTAYAFGTGLVVPPGA